MNELIFIKYVNSYISPKGEKRKRGLFLCVCGNEFEAIISQVKNGNTRSCGCITKKLKSESLTTHGLTNSQTLSSWNAMVTRCTNPNSINYKRYGAAGIKVCDRWLNSFPCFLKDMGERPSRGHTLDRFPDIHGNYEPGNVRWATRKEQSENKKNTVYVEYNSSCFILYQLAPLLNIRYNKLWYMFKHGKKINGQTLAPISRESYLQSKIKS